MFQSPGSIALQLGPLTIHWYGVIIGIGILVCYGYIFLELKRRRMDPKPIDDMAFWLILSGVLGARLYYVIFNFSYFFEHPAEILQIWKGGLAIHGALLGGAATYFLFCFRHKLSLLLYADVIMPGVLFAQALGRWGNFFNNEAFGRPTDLPWKLFVPETFRPEQYVDFSYFHPTFLYESLWNFAGFLFLVYLSRRFTHSRGVIVCSYLLWYSFGRFFIEGLRTDSLYLGPLRAAQVISIALFLTGLLGLIFLCKKTTMKVR